MGDTLLADVLRLAAFGSMAIVGIGAPLCLVVSFAMYLLR